MSSGASIVKNRKSQAMRKLGNILLILLVVTVFVILIYKYFPRAKVSCFSIGVGEGICVETQDECEGAATSALNCPKEKPWCCYTMEEKPGKEPEKAADVEEPAEEGAEEDVPEFSGAMEFYCKCKIEEGYLVADENFNKLDLNAEGRSESEGETDFKAKTGIEYEMQARGTEDIGWCKIKIVEPSEGQSGECSKDNGPTLKHTFTAGDFDINLIGYDEKDGTRVASAVVDINVEEGTT